MTGKVCAADAPLPPVFLWGLAERDARSGGDCSRIFVRMVTNILLALAAADGEVSRAERSTSPTPPRAWRPCARARG